MEVTGHLYRWHPSTTALTRALLHVIFVGTGRAAVPWHPSTAALTRALLHVIFVSCPCMEVTGHLYRWHPSTAALTRALLHVIFVGTGRAVHGGDWTCTASILVPLP